MALKTTSVEKAEKVARPVAGVCFIMSDDKVAFFFISIVTKWAFVYPYVQCKGCGIV